MIDPTRFPPDPYRGVSRPMFRTLGISASGLSAQRTRLDVIASNIANAETTAAGENGAPICSSSSKGGAAKPSNNVNGVPARTKSVKR